MLRRLRCLIKDHQWKPEEDNRYVCTHCGAHLKLGRGDPNYYPGASGPLAGSPDDFGASGGQ